MPKSMPVLGLMVALFGFVGLPVYGQVGWAENCPEDQSLPISESLTLSSSTFYRANANRHSFCKTLFYVEIDGAKHLVMISNANATLRFGDGGYREHAYTDAPPDCPLFLWDLYRDQNHQIYLFIQKHYTWPPENREIVTTRAYMLKENEDGIPGWTTWYFDPVSSYQGKLPPKYPDAPGTELCVIFQEARDIYEKIKPFVSVLPAG